MAKIKIDVNNLPVLTYRFLRMNEEQMETGEIETVETRISLPEKLPEGIRKEEELDEEGVQAFFAQTREKIKESTQEATPPNGDTSARYETQALPSGMGREVDRLLASSGVKAQVFRVPAGEKVKEPLVLKMHGQEAEESKACLARQVICAEEGAEVSVMIDLHTDAEAEGAVGMQTLLLAKKDAVIHLYQVQMAGEKVQIFDDIGAVAEENARIDIVRMDLGGERSYVGCHVNLLGKKSDLQVNTAYLCRKSQQYDMDYIATHRGQKSTSDMQFRGILMDEAKKTFRGTLDFKKGSAGASGEEAEDNLLFSDRAVNRTIPLILCEEEDVNGHHGATIGQLGEDLMFYCQARGISEEEARRMMVRARMKSVARMIPDDHIRGYVEDYLRKTL